jgi:hypothetical protein
MSISSAKTLSTKKYHRLKELSTRLLEIPAGTESLEEDLNSVSKWKSDDERFRRCIILVRNKCPHGIPIEDYHGWIRGLGWDVCHEVTEGTTHIITTKEDYDSNFMKFILGIHAKVVEFDWIKACHSRGRRRQPDDNWVITLPVKRPRDSGVTIIADDLDSHHREDIINQLPTLGLVYYEEACEETNYLCATQEQFDDLHDDVGRVQGQECTVVSMDWLQDSILERKLAPTTNYDFARHESNHLEGCVICIGGSYPLQWNRSYKQIRDGIQTMGGRYVRYLESDVAHVCISPRDCQNGTFLAREAFFESRRRNTSDRKEKDFYIVRYSWLESCLRSHSRAAEDAHNLQCIIELSDQEDEDTDAQQDIDEERRDEEGKQDTEEEQHDTADEQEDTRNDPGQEFKGLAKVITPNPTRIGGVSGRRRVNRPRDLWEDEE